MSFYATSELAKAHRDDLLREAVRLQQAEEARAANAANAATATDRRRRTFVDAVREAIRSHPRLGRLVGLVTAG